MKNGFCYSRSSADESRRASVISLSCMEYKPNSTAASSECPFAMPTLVVLPFDFSAPATLSTYKMLPLASDQVFIETVNSHVFACVRLLTVGWDKRFSRTWGAKREDWSWWAPEKSFWDSWN